VTEAPPERQADADDCRARPAATWHSLRPAGVREWLHDSPVGLLVLAGVVGLLAGGGAAAFRYLIYGLTWLFTGVGDYGVDGRVADPFAPWLGPYFLLIVPIVGGLIYGPLTRFLQRGTPGAGVAEVMLAARERAGRLRPRDSAVNTLGSAVCIGSGGSVGLIGPVVFIGSWLGSALGQWLRMPDARLRMLLACGAAGGISASFNAPVAGVFFAMEIVLRDFDARSFGMVVISSVGANIVSRSVFGDDVFLQLPIFTMSSAWELGLYLLLGLLAALVGVGFMKLFYATDDLFGRLWGGRPAWLRPAAGGILLGLILLALPQMYGVGYPVMEEAINGGYAVWFMVVLLVGKMVATSVSFGIGGLGGLVAPALFMGAMLGTAFGGAMDMVLPEVTGPSGAYGIVGMGAVFAATSRAPITATLIIFELTGEYRIILPLMFAVAIAAGVSHLLSADSIDALKLKRAGIVLSHGFMGVLDRLRVSDAMVPLPAKLPADLPLDALVARLTEARVDALPVVDERGRCLGVVTSSAVEEALHEGRLEATAADVVGETGRVHADETLDAGARALARCEADGLPVLAPDGETVVGWLTHRDVLRTYADGSRTAGLHKGSALRRRYRA